MNKKYEGWQDRLVVERKELKERLDKLVSFTKSENFISLEDRDKKLLGIQVSAMSKYCIVLEERIARSNNSGVEQSGSSQGS